MARWTLNRTTALISAGNGSRRPWLVALLGLSLFAGGCVTRAEHQAALNESEMVLSRTHDLVGRQFGGAYMSITQLKKRRAELEDEINAREKALAALHDKALAWKDRSDTAEAKTAELKTDMFRLGENVDRLRLKMAELQQQLKAAKNEKLSLDQRLAQSEDSLVAERKKREEWERKQAKQRRDVEALKQRLRSVLKAGEVSVAMRKGRLIVQLSNAVLFESGKTVLSNEGKEAVTAIGRALKDIKGQRIEVGGHTDNASINTARFPSNWELSTARAASVLHVLHTAGVDPRVTSAAGYGMHDPIASNDSPEGRAENRRIEIALVPDVGQLLKLVSPETETPDAAPVKDEAPPESDRPPARDDDS